MADKGTLSFFIPDVLAYRTLRIDGSAEVADGGGRVLGVFPKSPKEEYSWFVCSCEDPAIAVRAPSSRSNV